MSTLPAIARPVGLRRLVRRLSAHPLSSHPLMAYLPDVAAFFGALVSAVLCALLVGSIGGCGGGVGSEGTGSFSSSFGIGPITGFGSIVVNGVHYDERSATVLDDDGNAAAHSALALGMVVEVNGGPVSTAADGVTLNATATQVRLQRALVGPASAVDAAAGRLQVLGQVVAVSTDTVFASGLAGGLAAVADGQLLEVYGFYDTSRTAFNATHIGPAASGATWRISAPVASIDSAQTFTLGNQRFNGATSGLAVGSTVRLTLQPRTDGSGHFQVSTQRADDKPPEDREGAGLDGVVSSVLGDTRFVVNGVTVDSSAARVSGSVAAGAQVQVRGSLRAGVLVATEVQARAMGEARGFELYGSPSQIDTTRQRFVLRGITVSYAGANVSFKGGTAATLVGYAGQLKVKGLPSADRTALDATEIDFN